MKSIEFRKIVYLSRLIFEMWLLVMGMKVTKNDEISVKYL